MNNHHDIVYVPDSEGAFYVARIGSKKGAITVRTVEPLKDVFVFTKEQEQRREDEITGLKLKILMLELMVDDKAVISSYPKLYSFTKEELDKRDTKLLKEKQDQVDQLTNDIIYLIDK